MPGEKLTLPVLGRITDTFRFRINPITNRSEQHQGIDIAAPVGTPVTAPLGGVVVDEVSWDGVSPNGNKLVIDHQNGIVTTYIHLDRFAVSVGQTVNKGEIIAYVGNTGRSTGPHLHWQVKVNGTIVDPLNYTFYSADLAGRIDNGQTGNDFDTELLASNNREEYVENIIIDDPYLTTMQKFVDKYHVKMSAGELLAYKDNSKSVFNAYTSADKKKYGFKASTEHLVIGTTIKVPMDRMDITNPYKVNQTLLLTTDYKTFIESEIKKLIFNPDYKKINIRDSENDYGAIFKRMNTIRVWAWSRALAPEGQFLIDITKFVKVLNTNVGASGGNFSIQLPHITFDAIRANNLVNDNRTNFRLLINNFLNEYGNYESYITKGTTHELVNLNEDFICDFSVDDNNELALNSTYHRRKPSFFQTIFQENDIVFISFEKLSIDDDYNSATDDLIVETNRLKGRVFDMIGLIDINPLMANANPITKQQVAINGRDLSKLLLDDGVFFFPVEYAVQSIEQVVKNANKTRAGKRLQATVKSGNNYDKNLTFNVDRGQLLGDVFFNFDKIETVEDWLTFIFSQLVNIDICPDALLNSLGDKTFVISKSDNPADATVNYKRILANGIWQMIKMVTDKDITTRNIVDGSLSTDTGSLMNLVQKVCQPPFIETIMDTYGDKYYFMFRRPPFTESSFKTNKCINIFDFDVKSDDLNFSNEFYTWYRLTPMGSIIDSTNGAMMTELPAVMLAEYAEVWGMKILDIQTNYIDFVKTVNSQQKIDLSNIITQGMNDLDWLIESHAYLPFTRLGTITIKQDRRIKRGMNVRYMATGEVFYVEGVSHVAAFFESGNERFTVLNVSRGIIERHYDKYFNIVNLRRKGNNKTTWTVNTDIFNFLLQRKQFM